MGDDLAVSNAARVSFHKWKAELDDKDVKLIDYLAKNGHSTPFRHPQVSLRCEAPIFLARQLMKHQVGLSWNEVSRRYVSDTPKFYYPSEWRSKPTGGAKQGSGGPVAEQDEWCDYYQWVLDECLTAYNNMLAADIAPEMARMVLPQSMMTQWIWTGSLLAFFHVWKLRSDKHAQLEAQVFAKELCTEMVNLFPHSWKALMEASNG